MVQTGDPTGTGKGGQSIYGAPFPDEVRQTLKVGDVFYVDGITVLTGVQFNTRGIVAMANAGPDTNKSQVGVPTPLVAYPNSSSSPTPSRPRWMVSTRSSAV